MALHSKVGWDADGKHKGYLSIIRLGSHAFDGNAVLCHCRGKDVHYIVGIGTVVGSWVGPLRDAPPDWMEVNTEPDTRTVESAGVALNADPDTTVTVTMLKVTLADWEENREE